MIGTKNQCLKWLLDQPDKDYQIKEYHQKRSLTSNAYYWVLLTQLALELRTTKEELHEVMIQKRPVVFEGENGKHVIVALKRSIPVTMLPGHWMPYKENGDLMAYIRLKGSSEMDSKEFSRLLDELIEECQENGVETLTPAEIQKLKGYEKQTA